MRENIDFYKNLIRGQLSDKRYIHSVNSAEMCRELAAAHGYDAKKAYIAGLIHDICKDKSVKELKRLLRSNLLEKAPLDPLEKTERKLWHAPAGAVFIHETLGINDEDIILAVRFHTVGRAKMRKLEKIVYLGDLTERGRAYPDADKYRNYALQDLNNGMYEALKWAMEDSIERRRQISPHTLAGYNYYLQKIK